MSGWMGGIDFKTRMTASDAGLLLRRTIHALLKCNATLLRPRPLLNCTFLFYEVWLPTTFAKYFRFDSRLSLWLQLVLDSLIWNALNGKGLFWPPTIIWQHPEAVGYQSAKRSKTDANRDCDWGFLAWCRQRYVSTGRMDGRRTSAIWLISFLPFVRRFLWVINASRVTLLASAASCSSNSGLSSSSWHGQENEWESEDHLLHFHGLFLGHTLITKKFVFDGLWNEMGIFVRGLSLKWMPFTFFSTP